MNKEAREKAERELEKLNKAIENGLKVTPKINQELEDLITIIELNETAGGE